MGVLDVEIGACVLGCGCRIEQTLPSKYEILGGKRISVRPFQAFTQGDVISKTVLTYYRVPGSENRDSFVISVNFVETFGKNFNLGRAQVIVRFHGICCWQLTGNNPVQDLRLRRLRLSFLAGICLTGSCIIALRIAAFCGFIASASA
ncbi:hypothetical protein D3C73_1137020 [compost metagenome]